MVSQFIITDLFTQEAVMKVKLPIQSDKICIHPNMREVTFVSLRDNKRIVVDLSFLLHKSGKEIKNKH